MKNLFCLFVAAMLSSVCGCDDCSVCMEEKCADLIDLCEEDGDCKCMSNCMGEKGVGKVGKCLSDCDLEEKPQGFAALEDCVGTACPDGDECSVPGSWEPNGNGTDENQSVDTTLIDGLGGGDLADCNFNDGRIFGADDPVLQLESEDKNVCVRIVRLNEGSGALANTSWRLLEISLGPLGEVASVNSSSNHCWYSSHHNFMDFVHVWTGTRHYGIKLTEDGHGGARTYVLYAYEQGPLEEGQCSPTNDGVDQIGPPIPLFPFNP